MIKEISSHPKLQWSDRKKWIMGILAVLITALIVTFSKILLPNPEEVLAKLVDPAACRHISHGVERFEYSDWVQQSSGWVDGGKNPVWWCQTMKNAYQSTKPDTSIVWTDQTYSEEHRKSTLGHVTYNYHCRVLANWGPIYNEAVSEACE